MSKPFFSYALSAAIVACVGASEAAAQWVWTPETGRFVNLDRLPKETAELQLEYARTLMIEGRYGDALDETGKFREFYEDAPEADENQFLRGEIKQAQGDYVDAAREFQLVVSNYPESDLYDDVIESQYTIADSLFDRGQANIERYDESSWIEKRFNWFHKRPMRRAIEVYNLVKANQPFTPEAAEAQYKIGLSYYELEEYIDSDIEYRLVLEQYPDSEWVDDASYGRIKTFEASALPPEYDQAPSQLAVDAIDDFRVSFPADARQAELDELRAEMLENIAEQKWQTAQFYADRHLFNATRVYLDVIVKEYPETQAAVKAREWLEAHPEKEAGIGRFLGPTF